MAYTPKERRDYMRAWRLKNSEKAKRYEARYRRTHPELLRLKEKRRARRRIRVVKVVGRVRSDGFVAIEISRELFVQLAETAILHGSHPTKFVAGLIDRAIADTQRVK